MKNFGVIISQTKRSISYVKILRKLNIKLDNIIVYGTKKKNLKQYKFFKTKIYFFKSNKISKKISKKILKLKTKNFIISTYPGEIIKNKNLLKKKNIFHIHPGKIPTYKGSTVIYYSILNKQKIYCTVIKLSEYLDEGKIFFKKSFPIPKNLNESNYDNFDTRIRSATLEKFFSITPKFPKKNKFKLVQNYFVIHPILRKIAVDKLFKKKLSKFLKKNFKDSNNSLNKKIKIEQARREVN